MTQPHFDSRHITPGLPGGIRCEAAMALAHIGRRRDLVEPALTKNLNDPHPTVRDLTADALARFRRAPGPTP